MKIFVVYRWDKEMYSHVLDDGSLTLGLVSTNEDAANKWAAEHGAGWQVAEWEDGEEYPRL